jgi:hypothetical protein
MAPLLVARSAEKGCSFAPFRRLVGARSGAYSEFLDCLWKGSSQKVAKKGPNLAHLRDAYTSLGVYPAFVTWLADAA